MAQQVVRVRLRTGTLGPPHTRHPTWDTTWEQQGTNTDVNTSDIVTALQTFYNVIPPSGTQKLVAYMGPSTDTFDSWVYMYDITDHLDGSPAGAPIYSAAISLAPNPTVFPSACPEEVACVCSYRADYGTASEYGPPAAPGEGKSRPRARYRNRFYFGTLNGTALAIDSTLHRVHFASQFLTDMANSLFRLLFPTTSGANQTRPVVWSRTDHTVRNITETWVDDAIDIRRRRGVPAQSGMDPAFRRTEASRASLDWSAQLPAGSDPKKR